MAIDFPGSSQTEAFALNDAGLVVGAYVLYGVQHGFLLTGEPSHPANFQTIDFLGSTRTRAIGINNAGQMLVTTSMPTKSATAFWLRLSPRCPPVKMHLGVLGLWPGLTGGYGHDVYGV
jgi:hypothetical protein